MLGDEVTGPLEPGAVHPPRCEAECIELRAKDISDLTNSGNVERSTIDVHQSLEQRECLGVVRVDARRDRALDGRERCAGLRRERDGRGKDRDACGGSQMSS